MDDEDSEPPEEDAEATNKEIVTSVISPSAQTNLSSEPRGISPRAKSTAERLRVDPSLATGTGPKDRIIERDIIRLKQEMGSESGVVTAGQKCCDRPNDRDCMNCGLNSAKICW